MKTTALFLTSMICMSALYADPLVQNQQMSTMPKKAAEPDFKTITYVEFLYWKYGSTALTFGRDGVGLVNGAVPAETTVTETGKSFYPNFKYDPGFRVGLAFAFGPSNAFDCAVRYTWYYTNPSKEVNNFSPSFLPLNWLTALSTSTPIYSRAKFQMDLHFHNPEVQLGYTFKVNPYLALRPYMGLGSYVVDGGLEAKYDYVTTAGTIVSTQTQGDSFSWSIAPKIGLDFTARPIKNFSVYCGINFTQQGTQITMKTTETQYFPATGTSNVIQKGKVSQVRSNPLFGMEIGPIWDQWFEDGKYHFQLRTVWQLSTLGGGNISFLNNNNAPVTVGAEFRGVNVRALFEF